MDFGSQQLTKINHVLWYLLFGPLAILHNGLQAFASN